MQLGTEQELTVACRNRTVWRATVCRRSSLVLDGVGRLKHALDNRNCRNGMLSGRSTK